LCPLWATWRFFAQKGKINQNEHKLCETKPIFKMPKMTITVVMTRTNNYKQPTSNCQEQSQTNPILSAHLADKIALSAIEGPVVTNLSHAQLRDLSRQIPPPAGKSERRELMRRISLLCVTAFAVNGPAFLRLKRNFAFLIAFCTGCFKHLAWHRISPWTPFVKIFHDFSPKLRNKKVFRTLIRVNEYNQITSRYQDISFEIVRIFRLRVREQTAMNLATMVRQGGIIEREIRLLQGRVLVLPGQALQRLLFWL
jgi:hypothetical protein